MRSPTELSLGRGMVFLLLFYWLGYNLALSQNEDLPWFPKDTITPAGSFVRYTRSAPDAYTIEWGKGNLRRTLKLDMDGAPNHFAVFRAENDSVIILRRGCGMPCWYAVFLPLDSNKQSFEIEMPEADDVQHNLVAYNGDGDTIVWVENFLTHKRIPILGKSCGSTFNIYCVDSVSIVNRQFYLRWMTEYEFDKPKTQRHMSVIRRYIDF